MALSPNAVFGGEKGKPELKKTPKISFFILLKVNTMVFTFLFGILCIYVWGTLSKVLYANGRNQEQ